MCPAHPRSRGEDLRGLLNVDEHHGSPPLARGRPGPHPDRAPCARLTPARAGKTCAVCSTWTNTTAHPRSRGEDLVRTLIEHHVPGSPPLARGRLLARHHPDVPNWLTPARAGKTWPGRCRPRTRPAHPRSRGEDVCSRRGRGAVVRLTPARAGKTSQTRSVLIWVAAHPRSRGEDTAAGQPVTPRNGSPPLARGRPRSRWPTSMRRRLTPARAGKTTIALAYVDEATAHPRSRGEDERAGTTVAGQAGSPPLARGRRIRRAAAGTRPRLTPARAGKTRRTASRSSSTAAHPRSRGEDQGPGRFWGYWHGSPPLARGRQHPVPPCLRPVRLTPARAGKTLPDLHYYKAVRICYTPGGCLCCHSLNAIRVIPSKSIGTRRRCPAMRISNPCSLSAE